MQLWGWLKRNWKAIGIGLGILLAFLAGRKRESPDREKMREETEAIKRAIAHEEAEMKARQDEIDQNVKDKDARLDKLTKKFGGILLILLMIPLLTGISISAQDIKDLPVDSLRALYYDALDKIGEQQAYIQELEGGLREAVDLARGYRADWEAQRELTTDAREMIGYLKTFIESQQETIERQWKVIDRLTGRRISFNLNASAELDEGKINPGVEIGVSITP